MRLTLTFILLVSAIGSGCDTPGLSQSKSETPYKPKAGSNQIDSAVAESFLEKFRSLSDQELSGQNIEEDFNQRAAAA